MSERTLEEMLDALGIDGDFVAVLERESIVTRNGDLIEHVERIRVCWTLYDELGINLAGVEVVLQLLERLGDERQTHLERFRKLRTLSKGDAQT